MTLLKLAVGIGALILLFVWVDWREAFAAIRTAHLGWMGLGGFVILLVWCLDALRLHWMTPIDDLPYRTHLALALQSAFVMQFGFGVFSGDGYRVAGYALKSGKVFKPTAHLVASRIAGFSSVGLMAMAASVWVIFRGEAEFLEMGKSIIKSVGTAAVIAFAVLLAIFFALRGRKLPRWIQEARTAAKTITLRIWLLSIIMVLLRGASFWCILMALNIETHFYVALLASVVATLSSLLPVMGGIGVREGAYTGITTIFGIDPAIGLSAALLMRFAVLLATSVGLLLSLGLKTDRESVTVKS